MAKNVPILTERTEDADLVLSLLGEYAPKLRTMCEEFVMIRSSRERRRLYVVAVGSTVGAFIAAGTLILATRPDFFASSTLAALAGVYAVPVVGFAFYLATGLFTQPRGRRLSWLEGDLRLLAAKVEKLVRTASQLNENLPLELGRRLEFEFRILEAEATLKYCESVLVVAPTKVQEEKAAAHSDDATGTLPRITKARSIADL